MTSTCSPRTVHERRYVRRSLCVGMVQSGEKSGTRMRMRIRGVRIHTGYIKASGSRCGLWIILFPSNKEAETMIAITNPCAQGVITTRLHMMAVVGVGRSNLEGIYIVTGVDRDAFFSAKLRQGGDGG